MSEITLEQAVEFILSEADEDGLVKVFAAGNQRAKALRTVRASAVTEGATVRLIQIKPKYLQGLEGEVKMLESKRSRINVTVLLDEKSTERLRDSGNEFIPADVRRYELSGVPASACKVLSGQ